VLAACQPGDQEASTGSGTSPTVHETAVKELRDAAVLVIDKNCVTIAA
jgi:hypothetical protein